VISGIELFSKSALTHTEENSLRTFLAERVPVIELTSTIKKETIALRRSAKLKLPDCIVAATAITLNAILLTADKGLLAFSWPGFRT